MFLFVFNKDMPVYKLLVGSKVQVYRGIAKETAGGLKKKDIVQVKDSRDVVHYKSKKQQSNGKSRNKKSQQGRQKWTRAYKKSLSELRGDDNYYDKNILMFNPEKKYTGYTKKEISKGQKLYNLTKKYYTS